MPVGSKVLGAVRLSCHSVFLLLLQCVNASRDDEFRHSKFICIHILMCRHVMFHPGLSPITFYVRLMLW